MTTTTLVITTTSSTTVSTTLSSAMTSNVATAVAPLNPDSNITNIGDTNKNSDESHDHDHDHDHDHGHAHDLAKPMDSNVQDGDKPQENNTGEIDNGDLISHDRDDDSHDHIHGDHDHHSHESACSLHFITLSLFIILFI